MTPMMLQYLEVKKEYHDHILFYRLGDFYEMFFDDAKLASRELDLTLTGRDCGEVERAPMCGVPYHSAEGYIAKLVEKGYRVAICEQVEDAAAAVGLVKREVVRIITPATILEGSSGNESANNFLASLHMDGCKAAFAVCDMKGSEISTTLLEGSSPGDLQEKIINELALYQPTELLVSQPFAKGQRVGTYLENRGGCLVVDNLPEAFLSISDSTFFLFDEVPSGLDPLQRGAVGAIVFYLEKTQYRSPTNLRRIHAYTHAAFLEMDASARRNLELCETMRDRERKGSLLWVLDKTMTTAGSRMMKRFLDAPLTNCRAIASRQKAVGELVNDTILRTELRQKLSRLQDLERLTTRVLYGTANGKDCKAIGDTLAAIPAIYQQLLTATGEGMAEISRQLSPLLPDIQTIARHLQDAMADNPPHTVREGGIFREGYQEDLDRFRSMMHESRTILSSMESMEREMTGIKNLKISFNKVFGYYMEVTKSYLDQVPDRYIRKQTLVNCERFITQELKELESDILGAKEKSVALEYQLFTELVEKLCAVSPTLQETAQVVSKLDVLAALAEVAVKNHYVCPEVDYSDVLDIKESRHPVVEQHLQEMFVPNDVLLDTDLNRLAIITGPNMAGKSTYMRQVALIVIMAQMGSFIPAATARIGIVDKIFTRIGASDDLSAGQSTFMVEMSEVAYILKNAARNSLIVYDEIGRGTSTFDGMSIARAVVEYTAGKKLGAKTLFATHYHELSQLEHVLPGVRNYNISAKKRGDSVVFLRKILPGATDDSYGIEVASLAGVPAEVIKKAKNTLKQLEKNDLTIAEIIEVEDENVSFLSLAGDEIIEKLKRMDLNTMTPLEAMSTLFELVKRAKEA